LLLAYLFDKIFDRITVNPRQYNGCPCIEGMRIGVLDILELLATTLSFEQIIEGLPDFGLNDLQAAVMYTVQKLNK